MVPEQPGLGLRGNREPGGVAAGRRLVKTLLTGATGLLGGALLDLMLARGHAVRCLVRRDSPNLSRLDPRRVDVFYGDAGDEDALLAALRGTQALVHVAGIQYAPPVISAARRAGVERLLVVGSTSVYSAYKSRSGMRKEMEALVRGSGLDWTIIRPSMIYGSERDKNMHKLLRFLDRSPVFPMFGSGENLWQPVFYEDLARGALAAFEREGVGETYDLPGAEPLTYAKIVETAARALGRRTRILRMPLEPVRLGLRAAEVARLPLPVRSEQVMRLREDKAYSFEKARLSLGYAPRGFEEGIMSEVRRLRELGMVRGR